MSHIEKIITISPKTPGLLTRKELAAYLNVDCDAIPDIARRFGLTILEDHFVERVVWKQILGLAPADDEAAGLLRQQLQDIAWVSRRVGKAPSTIRDKIRMGTFEYSHGVQLGAIIAGKSAPRTRRFIPSLIAAQRIGDPAPDFRAVAARPVPPGDMETQPTDPPDQSDAASVPGASAEASGSKNNVLAQIAGSNAG